MCRFLLVTATCLALLACSPSSPASPQAPPPSGSGTSVPSDAAQVQTQWLQNRLDAVRSDHGLTAIGAVYATSRGIEGLAVSGVRARGASDPVQPEDAWHLGSNTKALTALLYGRLVDMGKARWGATLPDLFPDLAAGFDPVWSTTTIEDLLAHRSGVGQLGPLWLLQHHGDSRPVTEQRTRTVRDRLAKPPPGRVGDYEYSNLNYIIAGAAIERILSDGAPSMMSWEMGMQAHVFAAAPEPGAQSGWGFGAPSAGLQGHRKSLFGALKPVGTGPGADNPPALGPAGTLHAPLATHALLATEFLKTGSAFLPEATRAKLWTPYPDAASSYAMGWGIRDDPQFGRLYLHNGSNTMWLSTIIAAPQIDLVVIVNMNEFDASNTVIARDLFVTIAEHIAQPRPTLP